ncbi:hypothetical protein [Paraburkholderia sp. DGU8]|uniref:hypothetical protein n=1 Tax=Paraburkholderia sp. DGU8 TaxID=3161997 RepID=UPI003465B0CE
MSTISEKHQMFMSQVHAAKLPEPEFEYVLALSMRKPAGEVRFDFAWPDQKIAVQLDRDSQRIYEQAVRYVAQEQGWRVWYVSGEMVLCGAAITAVLAGLANEIASRDRQSTS